MLGNVLNPANNPEGLPNSRGRRRGRKRSHLLTKYAQQSIVGLIAFIVAASLLSQIIPSPTIPSNIVFIGPKNDYFQAHKDEYNTIFFGSSRVYNHVIPELFDTTANQAVGTAIATDDVSTEANTAEINSYNFGIPAMRAIDSAVLIEDILADPPKDLKWVFFESILDKGYEPIPNARTHRAMYWHTWENTALAARYIFSSDESLPKKAALFSSHLLPFLYNQMNVGRLFNQVLPSDFSEEEQTVAADFTANEGFFALEDDADPNRQALLQDPEGYRESVADLKAVQANFNAEDPTLSANKRMLLERIIKTVRAAGAEPIFLESPGLHLENDFQAAKRLGVIDNLLSYKDPEQFPTLYNIDFRHDADHLNETGSRAFTTRLAQDFSKAFDNQNVADTTTESTK